MFAELSDHAKSLHAELKSFMAEHVYPNEKTLLAPPADGAERWAPASAAQGLAGESQGPRPVESFLSRPRRTGPDQFRLCASVRDARPFAGGAGNLQLQRAGRRQHGTAFGLRHAGAEGALARAASGGRHPLVFRHDRAARRLVRRHQHRDRRSGATAIITSSTDASGGSPARCRRAAKWRSSWARAIRPRPSTSSNR